MDSPQVSIHKRMGDEDVARVYGGILLSHEKEWNHANCSTRKASEAITVSEASQRQVSCDITYGRESRSVVSDALSPLKDYTVRGILQARILEWVAFPFSRESSQPRGRTQVSCMAGGFFYQLSQQGSPRILEWVAFPFSRGSSQPRNWTGVSCMAGCLFTNWTMREDPGMTYVWSQNLHVSEYNRKAVDASI